MANPEHVEILKQGVEVWNRWREENPDIFPDLSGIDLGKNCYPGINFSKTNLRSCSFTNPFGKFVNTNFRYSDLYNVTFIPPEFSNVDISGANLIGITFINHRFSNVNFCNAKLYGSNFIGGDILNTDFSFSILQDALFYGSNINDSIFRGANLKNTTFKNTNLFNVDFAKSSMDHTDFVNVDLSRVLGLEDIKQTGPSTIGIDTIYKSNGKIPEVFLRGCGVPENFIMYMKFLTLNPFEYYSCFISYSHQDKSFARRLHDQLQERGIRCWLDEHQILPGDDIYEQVDRGIRLWDKVLLCCSQHSLSSWWVDNEVATAFSKEQQLMKDRGRKVLSLIPLNLDGYMFSGEWTSGKRQQIKERLAADFTGWESDNAKFEEQFERVVKALQTEKAREVAPKSRL